MTDKKPIRLKSLFAPIITVLILIILISRIDIYSVYVVLSQADMIFIMIAMLLSIFTNFISGTYLFHRSLEISGISIDYREAFLIKLGNYPMQTLLPMKLGELSVPFYLKKRYGYPFENGVYSALFKNSILVISLLMYSVIGICLSGIFPIHIAIFLVVALFSLPLLFLGMVKSRRLCAILPKKAGRFMRPIKETKNQDYLVFLILSLIHSIITIYNYQLMVRALAIEIPGNHILAFIPLILILGRLPISVSGIGVRESSVMVLFSMYAAQESLFGAGILFSCIDYIFPSLVGVLFTGRFLARFHKAG